MKLLIVVEHPVLKLRLMEAEQFIDEAEWKDENNLSQRLLEALDVLLKKHNCSVADLETVEVETQQASFTSARIARTVAKVLRYCLGSDHLETVESDSDDKD